MSWRKLLGLISAVSLAGVLCIVHVPLSFADELQVAERDRVVAYAQKMLQMVVLTENGEELFDLEGDGPFGLGDPLPAYSVNGGTLESNGLEYWPIYSGETIVAVVVTTTGEDGSTLFRLTTALANEIDEFMQRDEPCAVSITEDGEEIVGESGSLESNSKLITSTDGLAQNASRKSFARQSELTSLNLNSTTFNQEQDRSVGVSDGEGAFFSEMHNYNEAAPRPAASLSPNLGVKCYRQDQTPLCWATSVASISFYLTGMTISPYDISMKVLGKIAGGTADNAVQGFKVASYYTKSTQVHADKASAVSDQNIKNWINSGIPIYARLYNSTKGGHAVVVCGYAYDSSGDLFTYIMNPGYGRYEIMAKDGGGTLSIFYNQGSFKWTSGSVILTRWQKPYGGSKWAYMNANGTRTTGWAQIGGWYYFNSSGYMLTGWQWIGGAWYYLQDSGEAAPGWHFIDGYWYAFDSSCAMRKGWFKDGSSWYYLRTATNTPGSGPEGSMLANGTWTIDGKAYRFNSSGVCLNP